MLKKIAKYFFILFGLLVLWASTSTDVMQFIDFYRNNDKWWGEYDFSNGGLVGMAHLDMVKKFNSHAPRELSQVYEHSPGDTIDLVMYGDSYVEHLRDVNFKGVARLQPIDRRYTGGYLLDSSKKNILIIEIAELELRDYFSELKIFKDLYNKKQGLTISLHDPYSNVYYSSFAPKISFSTFFNKRINPNLEWNLVDYNFAVHLFESKAVLNYYFFNRASGDVVITANGEYLLYKPFTSKYCEPVTGAEVAHLVDNMNAIAGHYKKDGFSEVYLAIIPNTASIVIPKDYNNLIPLLQGNPNLKVKFIDIYTPMKKSPCEYFCRGDIHWNIKGKQYWVDRVNDMLVKMMK